MEVRQELQQKCFWQEAPSLPSLAGGGGGWDEHTPNAYESLLHWYLPPTDTWWNSISSGFLLLYLLPAVLHCKEFPRGHKKNLLHDKMLGDTQVWVSWGSHHWVCSSTDTHTSSNECRYASHTRTFTSHVHLGPRERECVEWESHTLVVVHVATMRVADAADRQTTLITRSGNQHLWPLHMWPPFDPRADNAENDLSSKSFPIWPLTHKALNLRKPKKAEIQNKLMHLVWGPESSTIDTVCVCWPVLQYLTLYVLGEPRKTGSGVFGENHKVWNKISCRLGNCGTILHG